MAIEYNDLNIKIDGIVSEHEIGELREYFQTIAPEVLTFDLNECDDIHTALLQVINAYNGNYGCIYSGDNSKAYMKFLNSFVICENSSN